MPNSHIDAFFTTATNALQKEDEFLAKHLAEYQQDGFYRNYHPGTRFLFETTLVYLIFRELLATDFARKQQCEVGWEESYPGNLGMQHVDLLLKPRGNLPSAYYIEFKIWKHEYAEDLKADMKKMSSLISNNRCFLLALWWYPLNGQDYLDWLKKNLRVGNLGVNIVHDRRFNTRCLEQGIVRDFNMILALLEVIS